MIRAALAHGEVLLFPEPRSRQIRMLGRISATSEPMSTSEPTPLDLPYTWAERGPSLSLDAGTFARGEYATFQLGLFAGDVLQDAHE